MMTKDKATKLYLKNAVSSPIIIKRIMEWDERLTIRQNSEKMGQSINIARQIPRRFGVKFKKDQQGGVR